MNWTKNHVCQTWYFNLGISKFKYRSTEGLKVKFHLWVKSTILVVRNGLISHGRLYTWTENSSWFFLYLKPVEISKKCFNIIWTSLKVMSTLYIMGREQQSQNRVYVDCERTAGPIYLKFWHKISLMRTTEIQKMRTLAAKLTDLWLLIFQN